MTCEDDICMIIMYDNEYSYYFYVRRCRSDDMMLMMMLIIILAGTTPWVQCSSALAAACGLTCCACWEKSPMTTLKSCRCDGDWICFIYSLTLTLTHFADDESNFKYFETLQIMICSVYDLYICTFSTILMRLVYYLLLTLLLLLMLL